MIATSTTSQKKNETLKSVFLLLANFRQILTWKIWFWQVQRIFHEKKKTQICGDWFWRDFFFKLQEFCDKFQYVAKNIEGFKKKKKKELSYLLYRQIWLNYFLKDCHFGYLTKSLEETLVFPMWQMTSELFVEILLSQQLNLSVWFDCINQNG